MHRREGWGRHCSSCCLSSFHPKEPLRDSWEPSKSRQCGLTSWNSAEPLSLGDPRRCPNKQKAAGKQWAGRSGRLAQPWGGGGSPWFPGAWDCGLWALWLAAGSWSLGSVQQTAQMLAGWAQPQRTRAGPLGSMACTRVSTDSHVCSLKSPGPSASCEGYRLMSLKSKQTGAWEVTLRPVPALQAQGPEFDFQNHIKNN